MKTHNSLLKIITCIVVIILYSTQLHSLNFKFSDLFRTKKTTSLHNKSCQYHIQNTKVLYNNSVTDLVLDSSFVLIHYSDIDGDGVPDKIDDCPVSFGQISLRGCPPINYTKAITYGNPTVRLKDEDYNSIVEIFKSLNFEGDKQLPCKESKKQLNKLVKFLKKEKKLYIYISSYVDFNKDRIQNYYLSQERVNSVRHYLVSNGIAKNRIGVLFFGDSMPVVDLPVTRFEVEICDKKK